MIRANANEIEDEKAEHDFKPLSFFLSLPLQNLSMSYPFFGLRSLK